MLEVSWGPMLAAFSVTLDQSDDRLAAVECLQGFRYAVHVTPVMGMQTQRDAFVTSMAKFTNLHCAGDMKQKNVDAVKAIISIAIEDGNHLQDAWEHILTCLSRIQHLQLLGEGAPSDASYFASSKTEEKKALGFPNLKKKGALQNPVMMAVVRGGSYDSSAIGPSMPALVRQDQINSFVANIQVFVDCFSLFSGCCKLVLEPSWLLHHGMIMDRSSLCMIPMQFTDQIFFLALGGC